VMRKRSTWFSTCTMTLVASLAAVVLATPAGATHNARAESGAYSPIYIGAVHDLTGPIAPYGQALLNGTRMAVADINRKGGIFGRYLKVVPVDSASNFSNGGPLMLKLASNPKIVGIVGPTASASLVTAAAFIKQAGIPAIAPSSTDNFAPGILNEWTFRTAPIELPALPGLLKALQKQKKFTKMAILYNPSNNFSVQEKDGLVSLASSQGYDVVQTDAIPPTQTDFSVILTKLQSNRPDVIWNGIFSTSAAAVMQQARDRGISATFMGGATFADGTIFKLAGNSGDGAYTFVAFDPTSPDATVKGFISRYTTKFGVAPTNFAALGYDAAAVLAAAIKKAGPAKRSSAAERAAVRTALSRLKGVKGLTGTFNYNGGADNTTPGYKIMKVVNGNFQRVGVYTP
jgi:branched-chain amino acid transport system substrate-binding protein